MRGPIVGVVIVVFLVLSVGVSAHEVATGDPAHDAAHLEMEETGVSTGGVTIPLWGIGLFFVGLILFALAMGYYLQPHTRKH